LPVLFDVNCLARLLVRNAHRYVLFQYSVVETSTKNYRQSDSKRIDVAL